MADPSRRDGGGPRWVAVKVLQRIARERAFSNRIVGEELERVDLDRRDRGFVTNLVYGVLRHQTRLDLHIDAHAKHPHKIKGEQRQILRLAVFEVLELQRQPAIVISEATGLARRLDVGGTLSQLVHAILGAVIRDRERIEAELAHGAALDVMERRYSIPRWIAGRWLRELGPTKALERVRRLARPAPVDLRVDTSRTNAAAIQGELQQTYPDAEFRLLSPYAIRCERAGDVFYGPQHDEGLISVQSFAAQQAALWLAPLAGERVLDACAGIGVKTLQLAELMERTGTLVAVDADERTTAKRRAHIARGRLDVPSLQLHERTLDLRRADAWLGAQKFDAILCDVPCTGLGNLRRHPEIRWFREYADIRARAELQLQIARTCAGLLAGAGRMVYAACSTEPEETSRVVAELVAGGSVRLAGERTWTPEDDDTDGFYCALLMECS